MPEKIKVSREFYERMVERICDFMGEAQGHELEGDDEIEQVHDMVGEFLEIDE